MTPRVFFFRRNWRERILLMVVLIVALSLWLGSIIGRAREAKERWAALTEQLRHQQIWLDAAPGNTEALNARLAQIQQGKSLNANQLVGQLDNVLKRQGLKYRLDPPTTERRPPVAINSVALSLEKVELAGLVSLGESLRTDLPLVNIEQMIITPDRRNPAQLDVRLKLSGFELLP